MALLYHCFTTSTPVKSTRTTRIRNYCHLLTLLLLLLARAPSTCHAFSPPHHRQYRCSSGCSLDQVSKNDLNDPLPPAEDFDDEPLSLEYNSVELDESEILTGPHELEQTLATLFAQTTPKRNNIMPNSQLIMDNPNIPDLQAFVDAREGKIDMNSLLLNQLNKTGVSSSVDDDDDDDDDDSVWLGEDDYTNFRSLLNPDGTIRPPGTSDTKKAMMLLQPNTLNPSVGPGESTFDNDVSLHDLFLATPPPPNSVDESLHEQIMREEQGFLKSSQAFSNFLGPDGDQFANEARGDRRTKYNQERSLKQQKLLDRELQEVEASFRAPKMQHPSCRRCGCDLSPLELSHSICTVCYGEELEASSDMAFLEKVPQSYNPRGNSNDWDDQVIDDDKYGMNTVRPVGRGQSVQGRGPNPQRPLVPRPMQMSDTSKGLNAEVIVLQQQVKQYKRQCEIAEREIIRLRNLVADLQDEVDGARVHVVSETPTSPWTKVIDPDSGEEFFWNEETEEMKWEM